jgi:hypothetical protein
MQEYIRMLLDVSIIFAIVGISWQLIRLLAKATDTMDEFRKTNEKVNVLVERVSYDYEYISSLIKGISATIERVNEEILTPIRNIGNLFRTVEGVFHGVMKRIRPGDYEEDYLPDAD